MIRLGIIGAGEAAHRLHLPTLEKMVVDVDVSAVVSRTTDKAEQLARRFGGSRVFSHYHEMLESSDVDAVLVTVPIHLNAAVLRDVLDSGKHVIAEKPIAATVEEARRIVELSSKPSQVVLIAENFRYRADIRKARDLIAAGLIGEVFTFQVNVRFDFGADISRIYMNKGWRRQPDHPGGFVLDCGIHSIAGLRDVLGEVAEVTAEIMDRDQTVSGPDSLWMQLKLRSGAIGQYFSSYTVKDDDEVFFALTAWGEKGTLRISEGKTTYTEGKGRPVETFDFESFDRGLWAEWTNFVGAIERGETVISTPREALEDLVLFDAAFRSANTGQKVIL